MKNTKLRVFHFQDWSKEMKEKDKSVILPLSALFNALCKKSGSGLFHNHKELFQLITAFLPNRNLLSVEKTTDDLIPTVQEYIESTTALYPDYSRYASLHRLIYFNICMISGAKNSLKRRVC